MEWGVREGPRTTNQPWGGSKNKPSNCKYLTFSAWGWESRRAWGAAAAAGMRGGRRGRGGGHLPAFIMSVPSTAFMGLLETFFSAGDGEERRPPEPERSPGRLHACGTAPACPPPWLAPGTGSPAAGHRCQEGTGMGMWGWGGPSSPHQCDPRAGTAAEVSVTYP